MRHIIYLFIIILSLCFVSHTVHAQEDVKIRKKEFYKDKAGFKEAWKNIKKGDKYYRQGKGTYRLARDHYLKAYKFSKANPELNYKIGACYVFTDDKYEAINYLQQAYDYKKNVAPDIHYLLGRAYHLVLDFDKAMDEYNTYKTSAVSKKTTIYHSYAEIQKLIDECLNGKALVNDPIRVIISNLGDNINSKYDDYSPVFNEDFSTMFFTSRRQITDKSKRSPVDFKFTEDVYSSYNIDGEWSKAKNIGKPVNTDHNEAIVGVSPKTDKLYIYFGNKNGGDIFISTYNSKKRRWKSPKSLSGKINSKEMETSISISPDKKTLYFVSSNRKLTRGKKDIMMSKLGTNGKWQKPTNIGSAINTLHDEEGVYVHSDGKTLYFSSKGHNTMGGFDVFKSTMDDYGKWGDPVNLGYPINTPDDDLFYSVTDNEKYAYYTTIRESGLGEKDIYKVIFLGAEKEAIMSDENRIVAYFEEPFHSIFFQKPPHIVLDNTIILKGKIYDSKTKEPVMAKMELFDLVRNVDVGSTMSNDSGFYRINLPGKKKYGIEIMAKNYLFFLDVVDITNEPSDEMVIRDFALDKVEIGSTVILKNIFFEFGKATLKTESYEELGRVVELMKNNPSVQLEISGHTDNIGSLRSNMKLSESRAKSVVDYLVSQGIQSSRLVAKGYAFTKPIAPNNTEEGRSQNRRVEFKVLSK